MAYFGWSSDGFCLSASLTSNGPLPFSNVICALRIPSIALWASSDRTKRTNPAPNYVKWKQYQHNYTNIMNIVWLIVKNQGVVVQSHM